MLIVAQYKEGPKKTSAGGQQNRLQNDTHVVIVNIVENEAGGESQMRTERVVGGDYGEHVKSVHYIPF